MNTSKKKFCALLVFTLTLGLIVFCLSGCSKADTVNYNISHKADNFGILRRITVINVRDNNMLYELEAFFSLSNSNANELIVTSQIGEDKYTKDYIYLNEYTTYVVQQLEADNVSPYHYKFTIFPRMIAQLVDIDVDW